MIPFVNDFHTTCIEELTRFAPAGDARQHRFQILTTRALGYSTSTLKHNRFSRVIVHGLMRRT
jgi:hypothetical protein